MYFALKVGARWESHANERGHSSTEMNRIISGDVFFSEQGATVIDSSETLRERAYHQSNRMIAYVHTLRVAVQATATTSVVVTV